MIVSRNWLQTYFDRPLPDAAGIDHALTFHAFEIDGTEEKGDDVVIDVKVLPNRAADCLSHRGIAKELGAILQYPMKPDALRAPPPSYPPTDALTVAVEDARACPRYMLALVRGVKVAPSPQWLKSALESVGQRSINNVVDATNFVMLNLGQPLHAFDAARLAVQDGTYAIGVRGAKDAEPITTLSGESFKLQAGTLVITDAHADAPIGIAGVKGGTAAQIAAETTDIIIESANFDGVMVRRAMQQAKLYTDAGKRFQNNLSPELAAYAMSDVLSLIKSIAGGELAGVVDFYPAPVETTQIPVTAARVNAVLGSAYQSGDLAQVFDRLGLAYKRTVEDFVVDPPFERRDLSIPEDLAEEVGRILGYDGLPALVLPAPDGAPDQARLAGIERMKDFLVRRGFTELSTQSFAADGARHLINPLQDDRPALRDALSENMQDALSLAAYEAPRSFGPVDALRLFEIGTVWKHDREHLSLALGVKPLQKMKGDPMAEIVAGVAAEFGLPEPVTRDGIAEFDLSGIDFEKLGEDYAYDVPALGAFRVYSAYPFILRDIAFWAPAGTDGAEVVALIRQDAGALLARIDQFDRFEKDGRISYAFRLVFESADRTLSDEDVNPLMEKVSASLAAKGFEVR
ncbi:MAG TPA: phenylalanine--tRNA ligase subunit beta [Candidatus Paceibacterota bacterium]